MIVSGSYGSSRTPCDVLVLPHRGGAWYCVEGSQNVNYCPHEDLLVDGVWVEELEDTDYFYAAEPIFTEDQLERAVND